MKPAYRAIAITVGALATASTVVQAEGSSAAFAGHWRVAGVAVSKDGVQALSNNDPSLMGKRLTFSIMRLGWDQPTVTHDSCVDPRFTRLGKPAPADLRPQFRQLGIARPRSFTIHCRSGSWGPGGGATIYRGAGGVLAMPWYDGGLLKLARR